MIRKIFNLLLPLLVLCAGCTKENMDDCDSGLQLHFSHSLNPYNEDRFHSDVNKLSIFVFDSNDVFYDLFVIDDPAMLGHDNSINLPLPEGTWDIVTWGGDMITYGYGTVTVTDAGHTYNHDLVKGETSLEDFRLWINNFTDREDGGILLTEDLSRLYYGRLSGVEIVQGSTTYGEVAMVLNTNTLRINIKGLSNLNMRGASDFNVAADSSDVTGPTTRSAKTPGIFATSRTEA